MQEKIELLERLTALWKSGILSDAEFRDRKGEVLSSFRERVASATVQHENTHQDAGGAPKAKWLWVAGSFVSCFVVLLAFNSLHNRDSSPYSVAPGSDPAAASRSDESNDLNEVLPEHLKRAASLTSPGRGWSRVTRIPQEFQGRYGPQRCTSVGYFTLTNNQQIMYWPGDPPDVMRTFSQIFVSGDRVLLDASPDAISVYKRQPNGDLVTLAHWFSNPALPTGNSEGAVMEACS